MKPKKRNVLAMLGWYDHRILMGIARFAREADWHLPSRHLYDVRGVLRWKGDGVLTTDTPDPAFCKFIRRQSRERPTVQVGGGNSFRVTLPQVCEDNRAAGEMAARHFLERGYVNFAWYSPDSGVAAIDRCAGFRQALVAAGLDCTLLNPPGAAGSRPSSSPLLRRWLSGQLRELPKPLALFAVDDQVSVDVIELCLDLGLAVPQSVAVLGVGNLQIACECSHVPISSIELDFDEMGYRAAEMLEGLMSGAAAPAGPIVLPPTGVAARRSTDQQASMDPNLLQAIQFIKDNFRSPMRVDDIAEQTAVSSRTLRQLFARELKEAPGAYLLRIRLERAKTLLRETDLKAHQIAEAAGMESERNLRRAFQRTTGVSLMAFRHRHRAAERAAARGGTPPLE